MFSHSLHDIIQALESKYGISEVAISPADVEVASKAIKANGLTQKHLDALAMLLKNSAIMGKNPVDAKFMHDKFSAPVLNDLVNGKMVKVDMNRMGKPSQYTLLTLGHTVAQVVREQAFRASL